MNGVLQTLALSAFLLAPAASQARDCPCREIVPFADFFARPDKDGAEYRRVSAIVETESKPSSDTGRVPIRIVEPLRGKFEEELVTLQDYTPVGCPASVPPPGTRWIVAMVENPWVANLYDIVPCMQSALMLEEGPDGKRFAVGEATVGLDLPERAELDVLRSAVNARYETLPFEIACERGPQGGASAVSLELNPIGQTELRIPGGAPDDAIVISVSPNLENSLHLDLWISFRDPRTGNRASWMSDARSPMVTPESTRAWLDLGRYLGEPLRCRFRYKTSAL